MENGTFAHVWWSKVDLEQALLENEIPNTPENIEALLNLVSEDEQTAKKIQTGREYIYDKVSELEGSDD